MQTRDRPMTPDPCLLMPPAADLHMWYVHD
jgi:hypothetical protein